GAVIENGTGIYLIRKVDVSWLYDQSQEFGDITIRQEGSKKLANNKFSNVVGHRFTLSCFSRLAKVVSLPTE
ncbi:MAG: hypothetical protein ABIP51_01095, partial [Bacteroidia bacterium]